jgi:hypothetical protein
VRDVLVERGDDGSDTEEGIEVGIAWIVEVAVVAGFWSESTGQERAEIGFCMGTGGASLTGDEPNVFCGTATDVANGLLDESDGQA